MALQNENKSARSTVLMHRDAASGRTLLTKPEVVKMIGGARIFGLADYLDWLERMASRILGVSGSDFEAAYRAGAYSDRPAAHDIATVLPIIEALRARQRAS
jgi:hypothetical protein